MIELLPWTLILPTLGAILVALTGRSPNLREAMTLLTAGSLFALVCSLWPEQWNIAETLVLAEPVRGIPIALHLEPLGLLFALVASFLWIVTTVYAIGYMRGHDEQNQTRFYVCFAIAIAGAMGVAFSANLFTLFLFYEILTISTYPLVTHAGTDEARKGGRIYLGILIGTSVGFQLPAIIATWYYAGSVDFQAGGILSGNVTAAVGGVLLTLYIFGIGKAATMPFHRWLPAAMVAPTPVSALLHAVAVVKAGVFTVLKVVTYIFGVDFLARIPAQELLMYVAMATVLLASLVAMRQDNLKKRLAYSTVSQLGYIVLGALLASSLGIIGGAMHIATHAFGKITLFFAAGAIMVAAHKTEISEMRGLGKQMPLTFGFFTIGTLSIIGLPPMAGTWSKWYLIAGGLETGQLLAVGTLLISTLLNIAYLLPISMRAFFSSDETADAQRIGEHAENHHAGHGSAVREAPWPCLVAMAVTSAGCLLLFFAPGRLHELAMAIVQ